MRRWVAVLAVVIVLGGCALAEAAVFIRPPEQYAPSPGWSTTYPPGEYQRNVLLDFALLPDGVTQGDVGGPTPCGIPGADYEGFLDPTLWVGDFVSPTGVVFDNGTVAASSDAGGSILIHLANLEAPNPIKEIWIEWVSSSSHYPGDVGYVGTYPTVKAFSPPSESVTVTPTSPGYYWLEPELRDGWYVHNVLVILSPNPVEENIVFEVPEYNLQSPYFIDSIQIATNCIPEPAAIAIWGLLGAMALGLVWWRRPA